MSLDESFFLYSEGGQEEAVVGVGDAEARFGRIVEHAAGQRWHPHAGVRVQPVFWQTSLKCERFGLVEDCGVAGHGVNVLGKPVAAIAMGGDCSASDDEQGCCDTALLQPLVEFGEQSGGLVGGELMPTMPGHAVTRSRAGT